MPHYYHSKNIVHGSIHANGNVHIGDVIYHVASDFQSGSILFLRLDKTEDNHYIANLSVKSKHSTHGALATSGEIWCENIDLNIPPDLFEGVAEFQNFRRSIDAQTRYSGKDKPDNHQIQAMENHLSQLIFNTFFAGDIGKACADFIQLLEEQRIEELLLAISSDDAHIVNLPFEMALPLLFPPKLGEAKKSLAGNNFGLVRTKTASLEAFKMQGNHAAAAPLKMLFITALPENLSERGKMLQMEEEQTRLIRAIGALEATGDQQPKIVIEFLENASLAELDKALRERHHDMVHISGHGAYHAAENKGVLYFENEEGNEEKITGKALGETLRGHACVKLLILSACETAIAGSEGGVTEQAAAYGTPGIVAMRFAITDEGAKVFTTEFYTQLAKGLSLTRALSYAREALQQDILQRREQTPQILHIAEWFTPVVYQNQAVGALIDQAQPYHLPDHFYPQSSFLKTSTSRLIGEGFIGRKRYLIQMRQAFRAGRHVCLHGLGGLGKTTLAEAFAHNYDNHSHTTIIFRNGSQINEAHILQTLNKRFAKINPDLAEQMQQLMDDPQTEVLQKLQLLIDNYLRGRKTILIFDNVEDVQTDEGGAFQRRIGSEGLSAFLAHLCGHAPANCHILFTTRYKIEDLADAVEHLALDKMGYAEQYRLLNYSPILRGIPLQERDDVYKRLDGHPRGYEYLEALLKKDKTFRWEQVSKAEADVFENLLLAKVYERLNEPEKNLFQMASVFISRTPIAALAAVTEGDEEAIRPVLKSLQDWSLCFLEPDGRFEVHRLTREWMRQHITPAEKEKEWALKAAGYFENQPTWGDDELARA
ncbi:MAG: CHAT domain-containing protein, partial [Saprospiraceae bacterium]|nr:CHAT domain-containing protein [Saprospiraceae bacterium]